MVKSFSKRHFLTIGGAGMIAGALTARPLGAEPTLTSLRPRLRGDDFYKRAIPEVDQIMREAGLKGRLAFAVSDAKSGAQLEAENAQIGTPPASVTKAVTALYALDMLGPEHRFETRIMVTGGIVNGEVQGDLILVGGGDPTLDTDALAQMAQDMKSRGIIGVKGAFHIYEASLPVMARIDPEQPDHVGYNPGVSGLALNFNRVHFEWRRASGAYSVTMDARSRKYVPAVAMATMQIKDRAVPIYTYADGGQTDRWTVARGALGKGGARWLPVRKPGLYAGDVFATMAGAHGIRLRKPVVVDALPPADTPAAETIVTRPSPPLRDILRDMLKYSTNLTAEMVGLAATQSVNSAVASLRASAAAMNAWAVTALGMQGPALVDHSGLSDDSKMTAEDMVKGLVHVSNTDFRAILKPVAMRDTKGAPDQNHPVKVDAKTGTLNFVSGLAGYLTGPDGREMAFAIFAANPAERAKIKREDREAPRGARAWNRRAKRVQQGLLERWGILYGA